MEITLRFASLDEALETRKALEEHRDTLVKQQRADARRLGGTPEIDRALRWTTTVLGRFQ